MTNPLDIQVGGDHYKKYKIQPVEYIQANRLGWVEGSIIKYATRWRDKGGKQDLEKIKHLVELLIALEEKEEKEKAESWKKVQGANAYLQAAKQNLETQQAFQYRPEGKPLGPAWAISPTSEPTHGG
jgi:hypothetical protein